ncbi:MAG: ATP-binding cassette domain-containing protein, partial [Thermoleophilaceae bacterium]
MATLETGPKPSRARASAVPVVELRDVTKVYDGGSVGLERASMKIGRGEFVFLVGPTGCGKSTCIRLLMKELEPSRGEISIAGRTLGEI